MSTITIRVPDELMSRVKNVAKRDFSTPSDVIRRVMRLGLDADERRERVADGEARQEAVR